MIPSVTRASFFHRGSVHDKSTVLVVFVGSTALEPPIHRSLIVDTNIGLWPPTYHPRPLNRLTAIRVLAGSNNSRPIGFLL